MVAPPMRVTRITVDTARKVWSAPHGQLLFDSKSFAVLRLCRWSRNAFWINILNLFPFLFGVFLRLLFFSLFVVFFFLFIKSKPQGAENLWEEEKKVRCYKKYICTITAIMRVESERCEIAVENCNLGRWEANIHTHTPASHVVNLSPIMARRFMEFTLLTLHALNAAFFIHAKIEENLCVFFGRSLFCFARFHFTLLTQNFSVLGFFFFFFTPAYFACYQWCVWWWQRSTFNS
jgi:hypothetical protein